MGDPAGVGPELIARIWPKPAVHELGQLVVLGHPAILRRACAQFHPEVKVVEVARVDAQEASPKVMPCLRTGADDAAQVIPGQISAAGGQAAYDALVAAANLALAGEIGGIVTAPLNKAALWEAGHHYPGHTELLAELCGRREVAMMLYLSRGGPVHGRVGLGVVHVTLHMPLREVADVTREDNMAIICAVGDGLQRDPTFVSHLLEALGGVPIRMVSQAAARRNITLVIGEADLETALIRVHEEFFGVPA